MTSPARRLPRIRALPVALLLCWVLGAAPVAAQQLPPIARVYGTISINGANASVGAVVTAYAGTTLCGTSPASGAYDGTRYYVDLDSSQPACSTPGASISFQVNGQRANESIAVPATPGGAVQQNLTVGAGGASAIAPAATPSGPGGSIGVTYQAGWNLVSGPAGTVFSQASGRLYSLTALNGSGYAAQPVSQPVASGQGYWAYFPVATTLSLNGTGQPSASAVAPAGQFIMIGNPSGTNKVTVAGADIVYTYTPSGGYVASTSIAPGQGAWAYSAAGGTVTLR